MEDERSLTINSIIGEGTSYSGDIESIELLRIDGNFHGTAKSHDVILIGEQGKVKGTLIAPRIIVAGILQGTIQKSQLVILQSTGVVLGEINSFNTIIESGAIIQGNISTIREVYADMDTSIDPHIQDNKEHVEIRQVGKYSSRMLERLFNNE